MNILISGSRGFIGKKLLNYLINKNFKIKKIYILDRNNNIKNNFDNKNICIISLQTLQNNTIKIDTIIHLASKAHVKNFKESDLKYNFKLTNKLIVFSKINKVSKFIFLSSIKVYGENNHRYTQFSEDHSTSPSCVYSQSKYEVENLIKNSFSKIKIKYFIFRIPLVIGEGAKGNLLSIMKYLAKGIPLPLNYINNKRSFISMTNLIFSINNILNINNVDSGVYNLCDSRPFSTSELIKLIKQTLNSKSEIFYINKKLIKFIFYIIGKKEFYYKLFLSQIMNNTRSKNQLIWKEVITTEDEIKNMVIYFKKYE